MVDGPGDLALESLESADSKTASFDYNSTALRR